MTREERLDMRLKWYADLGNSLTVKPTSGARDVPAIATHKGPQNTDFRG